MAHDELMMLISNLYDYMDEEDKAAWSLTDAQEMIADQHTYECEHGLLEGDYDAQFWFDTIADMIEADTVDGED